MASETFCVLPWISLATKTDGALRFCCIAANDERFGVLSDLNGHAYNAVNANFQEAINADLAKKTRLSMLAGERPSVCKTCWVKESLGGSSRRQLSNRIFADDMTEELAVQRTSFDGSIEFVPRYLDMRYGNLCNLKCVMCCPGNSNQWYDDHVALTGQEFFYDTGVKVPLVRDEAGRYKPPTSVYGWHEGSAPFWQQVESNLKNIRQFYFAGGEPLMSKRHYKFLEECVSSGYAGDIRLEYDTNLTIFSQRLMELWKHFKDVWLRVSIEGIGRFNDFIRYPSHWEEIESNIEKIRSSRSQVKIDFTTTWQIYNVFAVGEIWDRFAGEGHVRILQRPEHFDVKILPKEIKLRAISFLEEFSYKEKSLHLINYLRANIDHIDTERLKKFIEVTVALDHRRHTKFEQLEPELWRGIQSFLNEQSPG